MQFDRFICPLCGGALTDDGRALHCEGGHSFDKARQGYVSLLPVQQKHSLLPGDDREMVAARRRFLESGGYAPFRRVLCGIAAKELKNEVSPLAVDAGCGEGYYTAGLSEALREACPTAQLCGFDISKFAVKAAAGRYKDIDFAVASAYAVPLPDACARVVTNVFSPIAHAEFFRILQPGGLLVFAVPSPRHLWALKEVLYDEPYENESKDVEYPGFVLEERIPVRTSLQLSSAQQIRDLFAMTPYAWKTGAQSKERLQKLESLTTEIGFDFLLYRRRP